MPLACNTHTRPADLGGGRGHIPRFTGCETELCCVMCAQFTELQQKEQMAKLAMARQALASAPTTKKFKFISGVNDQVCAHLPWNQRFLAAQWHTIALSSFIPRDPHDMPSVPEHFHSVDFHGLFVQSMQSLRCDAVRRCLSSGNSAWGLHVESLTLIMCLYHGCRASSRASMCPWRRVRTSQHPWTSWRLTQQRTPPPSQTMARLVSAPRLSKQPGIAASAALLLKLQRDCWAGNGSPRQR